MKWKQDRLPFVESCHSVYQFHQKFEENYSDDEYETIFLHVETNEFLLNFILCLQSKTVILLPITDVKFSVSSAISFMCNLENKTHKRVYERLSKRNESDWRMQLGIIYIKKLGTWNLIIYINITHALIKPACALTYTL